MKRHETLAERVGYRPDLERNGAQSRCERGYATSDNALAEYADADFARYMIAHHEGARP